MLQTLSGNRNTEGERREKRSGGKTYVRMLEEGAGRSCRNARNGSRCCHGIDREKRDFKRKGNREGNRRQNETTIWRLGERLVKAKIAE